MADITNKELQAAREAAGLYQYQVAHLMHVSEDVHQPVGTRRNKA